MFAKKKVKTVDVARYAKTHVKLIVIHADNAKINPIHANA
jgi:hypothetical protein